MSDFITDFLRRHSAHLKHHHHVIVGGLLIQNNKALIVRRSVEEDFMPGSYDLPGGGLKAGEKPEEGLMRTYFEETSIAIQPLVPYYAFMWESDQLIKHCIQIDYLIKPAKKGLEIKLDAEHSAYRWLMASEIPGLKMADELKLSLNRGFELAKQWNI